MEKRSFLEVETPILGDRVGGATARPFITWHNEMDKEFFIFGPDQVDLVNSGSHNMMKPKTVEGAAGTGKTISEF